MPAAPAWPASASGLTDPPDPSLFRRPDTQGRGDGLRPGYARPNHGNLISRESPKAVATNDALRSCRGCRSCCRHATGRSRTRAPLRRVTRALLRARGAENGAFEFRSSRDAANITVQHLDLVSRSNPRVAQTAVPVATPHRRQRYMRQSLVLTSCVLAFSAVVLVPTATAQDLREQFLPPIDFRPVSFDPEVSDSIGLFTSIANKTFKPSGSEPFPAVVHQLVLRDPDRPE